MTRSLERLFADAAHAVLVLDPADDRIRYANRCACLLLGYERAELSAIALRAISSDQAPELRSFLARVVESGHGWTKSLSLRTSRGVSLPAEMIALVIERGARPLVLVLARDRSQHRRNGGDPPLAAG